MRKNHYSKKSAALNFLAWAICASVIFFLYFASTTFGKYKFRWTNPHIETELQWNYYGMLSEAFLNGQLSLTIQPKRELLELINPYEPSGRKRDLFMWDTTLYDGKYFLYWGPAGVLYYLPFRLLFDVYPDDHLIILILSLAIVSTFTAIFYRIEVYYKKQLIFPLQVWALLFAFGMPTSLLLGGGIYVIAALSAVFFMAAAFYFLVTTLCGNQKIINIYLCGICTALSFASRPTFIFYVLVPFACISLANKLSGYLKRRFLVYYLFPVISGAFCLLLYNYSRFGSFFEFGVSYQLGVRDFTLSPFCSFTEGNYSKRAIRQVWHMLLSPPEWLKEFPYLSFKTYSPPSLDYFPGYFRSDTTNGVFYHNQLPILGFITLILFGWKLRPEIRTFTIALAIASLFPVLYLSSCQTVGGRYALDFQPAFLLFSILSLFGCMEHSKSKVTKYVLSLFVIYSIAFGILGSLDGYYNKNLTIEKLFHKFKL